MVAGNPGSTYSLEPGKDLSRRPAEAGLAQVMQYTAIFERGPASYSAYVPDLPGCVAAAETLEETTALIKEAIQFHIEGMRLHGEPVPVPTTTAAVVEAA